MVSIDKKGEEKSMLYIIILCEKTKIFLQEQDYKKYIKKKRRGRENV